MKRFALISLLFALSTMGLIASGTQEQNKDNSLSYIQEKEPLFLVLMTVSRQWVLE